MGTFKPYIIVIILLLATSLLLAVSVDVHTTDEAGIVVALPDQVDDWTGHEIRFCSNYECARSFWADKLEDIDTCPLCGGVLSSMTSSEADLLPADTVILKKEYVDPLGGPSVFVSIVLSGKERGSIHRPQVCLVGQGREIVKSSVLSIPIEGRKDLNVMVLDMLLKRRNAEGQSVSSGQYYAYWFVGKGRETPYHVQRMVWMGLDRVIHNVAHRWAYISVASRRDLESEEHRKQIQRFVHDLYPQMLIPNG